VPQGIKERIEQLIAESAQLSDDRSRQSAWLVAAQHVIELICPKYSPYQSHAGRLALGGQTTHTRAVCVSEMAALLTRLLEEIETGLLASIENRAIATTFDDFLDHGAEYLKAGRKNEAGVVAGIVFEDTVRRICRVLGITEKGVSLDGLISELQKRDALTPLKAKRARAAAGLRTSAAHARWEEFEVADVGPVIEFTRELLEAHLA